MIDILDLLNAHLASHIDLKASLKVAHWNCTGANFIGLHQLFDKAAGEVEGYYDTLAERARALDGEAFGSIQDVDRNTLLPEYSPVGATTERHVAAIMARLNLMANESKRAIQNCLDEDDQATADVFIEITRGLNQLRYLIGSHI